MYYIHKIVFVVVSLFIISPTFATNLSTWQFTPDDVNKLHSKPANYRISYGTQPYQFADLRLPQGSGPFPVAIIIHGGCWRAKLANLKNTQALADALRDNGIATWNIEYRSVDNAGGGWPGTFEDVANASDFLQTIANKYSLNLNKVIVIGHSAGGHMALWLAARHKLPSTSILYTEHPIKISGVIAMGGIPDLQAFRQHGKNVCEADAVGELLGNTEEQITRHYPEASPINLLPLGVPQILIYGKNDQIVPQIYGKIYTQNALKNGDKVQLIEVAYAAHHEYNVPNSVIWPIILNSIKKLLIGNKG